MCQEPATADQLISKIAERQHGILTIEQLRGAGVSSDAVKGRTRTGRLHRIHRGVYALGHPGLSIEAKWTAAALACNGALSHRSGAMLWGLLPPRFGPVDVSVAGTGGRDRRRDIRVHRSRTLSSDQLTKRAGIVVTTPSRTIADLREASARRRSGAVSPQELRRAIRQAEILGLQIDVADKPDRTKSELEHLFLRLCRRFDLSLPEVNVWIDSMLVDFLWRDQRLIVETDGYRYHGGRAAFENDRDRDLALKALGYEVIRLSYRQVDREPKRIAEVLGDLLRRIETDH
jgi:very-short-patch-repair endonuclease